MHKLGLSCAKLRAYVISRSFKMAAKIPKPVSESDLKPKLTFRISDLNSQNSVYFQKIYDLNIQDGYQTFKMVIKHSRWLSKPFWYVLVNFSITITQIFARFGALFLYYENASFEYH